MPVIQNVGNADSVLNDDCIPAKMSGPGGPIPTHLLVLKMKMFIITFLNLFLVLHFAGAQFGSVEAYFWRDFNGLIPSDAIKGGQDENGAHTYIAQFSIIAQYNSETAPIHTIPAVVKTGAKYALAAYGGRAIQDNHTSNTKILCSNNEYQYKWLPPTRTFAPNCRYVIAGNEDGLPMFVGRANYNKVVVVGKIFSGNSKHRTGLSSPYNGIEIFHTNYEILTQCT